MEETINGFLIAIQYCRDNKIKLVYPSSATVYNKNNSYAICKSILEDIQQAYGPGDVLGLRIFAGYGPGEGHKGEYASVIYQWCKQMKNGFSPVVYGDGTQTRDFVYIDDIIQCILNAYVEDRSGIIDICSARNTSFYEIIEIINKQLGTEIQPIYKEIPNNYIKHIKYFTFPSLPNPTSLEEGIKKILESL